MVILEPFGYLNCLKNDFGKYRNMKSSQVVAQTNWVLIFILKIVLRIQ